MTLDNLQNPESTENATETPVASVAVSPTEQAQSPTAPVEDWKKRFTGLQGQYQKRQQELAAAQAHATELEGLLAGIDTERTQRNAEIESLRAENSQLRPVSAQYERLSLIAKEFPDLLGLEADGLLPQSTGDDLREKLEKMRLVVANNGGTNTNKPPAGLRGSVPQMPSPVAPSSSQELLKAALDALKVGKTSDYTQLYDQYIKSLSSGG